MIGWIHRSRFRKEYPGSGLAPLSDRPSSGADALLDRSGTGPEWNADRSVSVAAQTPKQHAAEFLVWLQEPDGRTGWIPAVELKQAYVEFAGVSDRAPLPWIAVGRELRRLLAAPKTYVWLEGRKVRTYCIPPAEPTPLVLLRTGRDRVTV